MSYNGTYEPRSNFCGIFGILFEVQVVQFGIAFDKPTKIHLIHRNSKSFLNISKDQFTNLYIQSII